MHFGRIGSAGMINTKLTMPCLPNQWVGDTRVIEVRLAVSSGLVDRIVIASGSYSPYRCLIDFRSAIIELDVRDIVVSVKS